MTDFLQSILANADSFRWLFFIGLLWAFYSWMQGEDSRGIEWRDFVATKGLDGEYHGDIDRVGKTSGVIFGSVMLVQVSPKASEDFTGFAAVLLAYFAFVGAISGYSAYLRSKTGQVVTERVTEPVPDPSKTKTTEKITEPADTKKKGK